MNELLYILYWLTHTILGFVVWSIVGWLASAAWIYFVNRKCSVADIVVGFISGIGLGPFWIVIFLFAILIMICVNHDRVIWRRK